MFHKLIKAQSPLVPKDAIKWSEEVRNPIQPVKLQRKNLDAFSEDCMSRSEPSDEVVRVTKPDDTVLPG